jgi:hypothetical protein
VDDSDSMNIGEPLSFRFYMGVADLKARCLAFATNRAYPGHDNPPCNKFGYSMQAILSQLQGGNKNLLRNMLLLAFS